MNMIITIFMLAVNFGISWYNANTVGKIWSESKHIGGGTRVLAVSGFIMAIAGFTMVYSVIIIALIAALGNMGGYFSAEQLQFFIGLTSNLTYVLIVFAIIPTGIIIWINSLIAFWKHKSLRSGGIAAWNSFAMISNVISASRNLPSAIGRIFNSLKNQRGNGAIVMLAIVVVACCILGGYFTTSAIMKRSDRKYNLFEKVGMQRTATA